MTALLLTSIQTGNTSCANLSHKDLELLSGGKENISFFCSHCLPNVSDVLALYQTYYKLISEFCGVQMSVYTNSTWRKGSHNCSLREDSMWQLINTDRSLLLYYYV